MHAEQNDRIYGVLRKVLLNNRHYLTLMRVPFVYVVGVIQKPLFSLTTEVCRKSPVARVF